MLLYILAGKVGYAWSLDLYFDISPKFKLERGAPGGEQCGGGACPTIMGGPIQWVHICIYT